MATDLTVSLSNKPGTLADLGEALGKAGVNIEGLAGMAANGEGLIHILVQDSAAAKSALQGTGITVKGEREVVVAETVDKPGALGELARRIADAGANIDLLYLATNTRVVIGADDLKKVKSSV